MLHFGTFTQIFKKKDTYSDCYSFMIPIIILVSTFLCFTLYGVV